MKQSIFMTIYGNGFVIDEKLFNDDKSRSALDKIFDYLKIQEPCNGLTIEMQFTNYQGD